ncbi:MAG: DEAD/DEAH box helicase [Verrucomicrobia bacterium]|nr:MAG: DEAD/DEAH box helicase [Verrucomicrobiota bacterium]TAE87260.1 MAG: DEAD/DEAH box helicase [Verrucomicrobiota bacterium]TAF25095.1 MAG: DEAD/DEAH box helicase [Verrucomicrobiota bacterium]
MSNQNPEQKARDQIDAQLRESGWIVQDKHGINFNAGNGQAIREYTTDSGPADYVLFVDGRPVGVVEAKKETLGQNITTVEDQTADYAASKLKWIQATGLPLPFLYEATGVITRFTDQRDPKPRSREVFAFHRPETLREWLAREKSLRARLLDLPALDPTGLRDCQIGAITNLDSSFKKAKPRALVQMATGSGKTFTAITSIYRLLKHARVKRILFLVDTRNLGEQAEQEFLAFTPTDDNRSFTSIHATQRLSSSHVPADAQVCISTIQRMYSILQGREMTEGEDDINPAESASGRKEPLPVSYNEKVPPEFFDVIVIDECHRSIYNLWRQVLDYFDAFLVGLTATPDGRTYGFFKQNLVSEYTHEEAVADGVNVQGEIYTIETAVTQGGGKVLKGLVEKREKLTRAKRWEQQDEDQDYSAKKLDTEIVNPSQIRTVIRTFKEKLPEIFPDRGDADGTFQVPKTLIFAKTDSHADDIIQIVREEFDEGNRFCKKVTFKSDEDRTDKDGNVIPGEDPKTILADFRNDYYPRIAVTVDMIATGTDVKALECLLFMRDVKSKSYFEQMKGRGTRTLDHDSLKKVSSAAKTAKSRYVLVDAIGVTKSLKTASRPPITKPNVTFKDLAMEVVMGSSDPDTVSSLAGRLARIDRNFTPAQKQEFEKKTGGISLSTLTKNLFAAIDGETIEQRALEITGQPPGSEPGDFARDKAQKELVAAAIQPLTGALVTHIVETCKMNLQTIDHHTIDVLLGAGWDTSAADAPKNQQDFESWLRDHKDQIVALTIFYDQPQRRQELTFSQIKEVLDLLKANAPHLAPLNVWNAYARLDGLPTNATPISELTALVALIRRACGIDGKLTPFADTVRRNYRDWILKKNAGQPFTEAQAAWLQLIRDHVMTSFHLERDDLDYAPFDAQGGLGKMHQLFGEQMDALIDELNRELVA